MGLSSLLRSHAGPADFPPTAIGAAGGGLSGRARSNRGSHSPSQCGESQCAGARGLGWAEDRGSAVTPGGSSSHLTSLLAHLSSVKHARTAAEAVRPAPESARFVVPHLQLPAGAESAPKEFGFRLAFFLPRCVRLTGAHPAA